MNAHIWIPVFVQVASSLVTAVWILSSLKSRVEGLEKIQNDRSRVQDRRHEENQRALENVNKRIDQLVMEGRK